ncbi:hypothetical protein Nepgr_014336 [Nepenthes gracilis]|uniref:Ribosomal protein S11 n=1 Tax=Nepenthes gracilis TaxID=150966 RepID=A0AAD3XQC3_NEPGR|nr:hypothetical protein Nepgr_014336 [Nepenthes gracilis]
MIRLCRVQSTRHASLILAKTNRTFFSASSVLSCSHRIPYTHSLKQENLYGCLDNSNTCKKSRDFEGGSKAQSMLHIMSMFSNKLSLIRGNKDWINLPCMLSSRSLIHTTMVKEVENGRTSKSMAFVKGILEEEGRSSFGVSQLAQYNAEEKLDIVHIKMIKNNTFVTITDSKGNKKVGASSGCLEEMKGGPKLSRYAAEATAEHVGRLARNLGLKSVVMRVNGFTHFKKKKQAILSWREGFTHGRGDRNPIAFIEDTTRRPHNGCRLPKKRRV